MHKYKEYKGKINGTYYTVYAKSRASARRLLAEKFLEVSDYRLKQWDVKEKVGLDWSFRDKVFKHMPSIMRVEI